MLEKIDGAFRYIHERNIGSFSWADYCGHISDKSFEDFENAICPGDVIYVTFYVGNWGARFIKGIASECLRNASQKGIERALLVKKFLELGIERKVGQNYTEIGFDFYHRVMEMMTVGYHFKKNSPLAKLKHA